MSRRLAGEIVLAVVLGVTLAFSWSDATPPNNDPFDSAMATQPDTTSLGQILPAVGNIPASATTANMLGRALIPTAPPVQLLIPLLDVHRAVEAVGFDQSGALNLPVNAWNAGWFEYGPVPGAPGDAVIEGHAGYPGHPMMFGKLYTLRKGDPIIVVLRDRSRQLFRVVSMATVPMDSAPPGLADPYGPPRLTLITCTGSFDKRSYSYSKRLLLEARYVGPI